MKHLIQWLIGFFNPKRKHAIHPNPNEIFLFYTALLLATGAPSGIFAQKATAVTGVSITVADLDREVEFFTKTLDFQLVKTETLADETTAALFGLPGKNTAVRVAILQLGQEQIRLLDFDAGPAQGSAHPDVQFNRQTHSNDLWFQHLAIVVSDMDAAYQRLLAADVVHVSTAPQTLPGYLPNAAGIKAFYFRDPEGHNLELIWFPPGKGNPKWQPASSAPARPANSKPETLKPLFLGIDHTAIAISDTERSMAFYRDLLGLVHGGHSENYGTEQEHLNQVFGARLDINGLHADSGFGVEFLRYIAPPGGRPYPTESRPTDLWHYQTEFVVDDLGRLLQKLEKEGFEKTSATAATAGQALLRDPDGHAVLLRETLR